MLGGRKYSAMPSTPHPRYADYDPDGPGLDNGNFLGLPRVERPRVRFTAVPFDATVSFGEGTAGGPAAVLEASRQLDVCLEGLDEPWTLGFAWRQLDSPPLRRNRDLRAIATDIIAALERGDALRSSQNAGYAQLEQSGARIAADLERAVGEDLDAGCLPVVVGGEHSVALGAYRACAKTGDFGILQIDAHMDLRPAYEGFRYSHASVMHNALEAAQLTRLVQVGIRDYSPVEAARVAREAGRVVTFTDRRMQRHVLRGGHFAELAERIVAELPKRVWVSLDVDGLEPALCAHTGTPVPGGLRYAEAQYLLQTVVASGREILGMDVVEVATEPLEASVAARLAYDFACRAALRLRPPGDDGGG